MLHLKLLKNQEQAKPKTSRRREIIKIRAEIKEIETPPKYTKKSMKQRFFQKINKTDKPLVNLTKMRGEMTQISKKQK
jgi:hypothetical protein